jgi:hypothetical protein
LAGLVQTPSSTIWPQHSKQHTAAQAFLSR